MGKKWKCLNFKEKLSVIKMVSEEKRNIRDVIEHFKCGKTQIYRILRQKDDILKKYNSNKNINMYRVRERNSRHIDLDKIILDWYTESKAKSIITTGPMLQQKAKEVSELLNIEGFSASNGWLQSFKNRHNIPTSRQRIMADSLKANRREANTKNKDRLHNLNSLEQTSEQITSEENLFYEDKIGITATSIQGSFPETNSNHLASSTENFSVQLDCDKADNTHNAETLAENSCDIYLKKEPFDELGHNEELNINLERSAVEDNARNDTDNHPVQIFFKSMAATVMTFPPELIAETRLKVCQLVTEMELSVLRDHNHQNDI